MPTDGAYCESGFIGRGHLHAEVAQLCLTSELNTEAVDSASLPSLSAVGFQDGDGAQNDLRQYKLNLSPVRILFSF